MYTTRKEKNETQAAVGLRFRSIVMPIKRASISLLVAIMALSSFLFVSPASADNGDWVFCANENSNCAFSGTKEVRFGTNNSYDYRQITNGFNCTVASWGSDPAPNQGKQCYTRDVLAEGTPRLTVDVSDHNKKMTITFSEDFAQAGTQEALKDAITLERSETSGYLPLAASDSISFSSSESGTSLVLTLGTALTGNANAIKIAPGAFVDIDEVPYSLDLEVRNIAARDLIAPAFIGAVIYGSGSQLHLKFDKDFTINAPAGADQNQINALLKSKISVATDGEHFAPILGEDHEVRQDASRQIYMRYANDMKIVLGTQTVIKIAADTLKNAEGSLNEEMLLHVSPLVIQSAVISGDNHDVTISFYDDIFDNTDENLINNIYLIKDGSQQDKQLVEGDSVAVVSGKLQIHFKEALSGASNYIYIDGGALKDRYGNIQNERAVTAPIQANVGGVDPFPADTTAPVYQYSYFSNAFQDLNIVFNEDVQNAKETEAAFLQGIYRYGSDWGWGYGLPQGTTLTFSGSVATIHFAAPLTGYQYYFQFNANMFKDTAGNRINNAINTNWLSTGSNELSYSNGRFSYNGRWLSIQFNADTDIVDQTVVDGVSRLKESISYSLDHGATYKALDELDVVSVYGRNINILFHDAIKAGSIKVKIAEQVISDQYDTKRNKAAEVELAYNTPEITGYMLSNTASEFIFTDNALWRNQVKTVILYDGKIGIGRQLNSSEYQLSEGKITIAKGVFQEGQYYEILVNAEGYSTKYFDGRAYKSSELFYMTAPVVTTENGITAKINLLNHAYQDEFTGNQTVVFELFNGTTPVSIVAANLKLGTGTYSANFNVSDAATNPNYTVKAYVVSKYSSDPADVGLNLASVKTQSEFDLALMNMGNNNIED
ncbi:hemoblobin-interacting domain-containing protein [Paenibacillus sp. FJAT-27812]|uniref:hemoblobin-interacting domain-containing protein n=1 Tax=Paenibacillus sp. FJAT-27812 TaxID=1684143 RepID=UPI0006A7BEC5|nr:hemoblobin-interacting domain-containing protein [Paenibacillus sp. FJAT-27812]